jgi:peptidoglycan hydrolase-like protein with peptidoglycan-binding domain
MAERAHRRGGPTQGGDHTRAGKDRPAGEPLVVRLQRQVGNRAVADYVQTLAIQRFKEGDGPSNDVGIIQQQLNHVVPAPRVPITGIFDSTTTASAKAFQHQLIAEKLAGITEDGIVDGETHKQLKARAPSVNISGQDTVVDSAGHSQQLQTPALGTHQVTDATGAASDLKTGAKGTGVKELQQRINNSPTMADAARHARATAKDKLRVDGVFGPLTDAAVKQFQTDSGVTSSGVADPATWAKLEAAGFATSGHVEFDWVEEVEGVKNVGERAGFDWKLSKTALNVTVPIQFVKKDRGVDGRIAQWLDDIHTLWSTFRATNQSDPKHKHIDLDFRVTRGSGHSVDVFRFDHSLPKAQRGQSRSNSGTWYTIDDRRGMAPHEFGHLIGLADEYNRTEEHYVDVTGEEPGVGTPSGTAATAKTIADKIKAEIPLTDTPAAPVAASDDARWGAKLAAVVKTNLGSAQGGFSRLVGQQYQKAHGTTVYADMQAAFVAKSVTGFQGNQSDAVTPFLYSNRSLMGTMDTVPATGSGGKSAHDHPIEPRHVQPFVDIVAREWKLQTGNPDLWKPERR